MTTESTPLPRQINWFVGNDKDVNRGGGGEDGGGKKIKTIFSQDKDFYKINLYYAIAYTV